MDFMQMHRLRMFFFRLGIFIRSVFFRLFQRDVNWTKLGLVEVKLEFTLKERLVSFLFYSLQMKCLLRYFFSVGSLLFNQKYFSSHYPLSFFPH